MGKVWFIGAGPGAPDLLTVRGARLIGEADVVVWARSLVHEDALQYARPGAQIVESTTIPLESVRGLYERAVDEDLKVARVHSGDPSLYGAVMEQIELCDEIGLDWEIVPGVSSRRSGCGHKTRADHSRGLTVCDPNSPREPHPDA